MKSSKIKMIYKKQTLIDTPDAPITVCSDQSKSFYVKTQDIYLKKK